jgi:hypothetical protein
MNHRKLAFAIFGLTVLVGGAVAQAWTPVTPWGVRSVSRQYPWHGGYYDPQWGVPTALVVPPTAEYQTKWSWGVTNTDVVPIYPKFRRNYPGPNPGGYGGIQPTPAWPGHTDQFGVYYVRGPW